MSSRRFSGLGFVIDLEMPGKQPRAGLIAGLHRSQSRIDRFVFNGSFFPSATGDLDIFLAVRNESCSDGMSDREYGLSVDMFLSGSDDPEDMGLYSGCCSIAPRAR